MLFRNRRVLKQAKTILANNWVALGETAGFTVPSRALYPFQWNWDSGFIAYAYTHYDPEHAIVELETLFDAQWKNGFLPHIVFHTSNSSYFPGPQFWESRIISQNAPGHKETSGITQPPMHALAVWHIYKALRSDSSKKALLDFFYPRLAHLHRYLHTARDPEKLGLITIYHPWESGLDNSPRWDKPLATTQIDSTIPGSYERTDTRAVTSIIQRPMQSDYDKYIALATNLKRHHYNDEDIYADHPFKIKDIVFSTILYMADMRLKYIADALGEPTEEIDLWLKRFRGGLETVWDSTHDGFCDYDVTNDSLLYSETPASIIPLAAGKTVDLHRDAMLKKLNSPSFCGPGSSCVTHLAPSTTIDSTDFQENTYWRGPLWLNINWLLWKGLLESPEEHHYARRIAHNTIELVRKNGFYEYYNPLTGDGLGGSAFSWTAALIIDFLYEQPGLAF